LCSRALSDPAKVLLVAPMSVETPLPFRVFSLFFVLLLLGIHRLVLCRAPFNPFANCKLKSFPPLQDTNPRVLYFARTSVDQSLSSDPFPLRSFRPAAGRPLWLDSSTACYLRYISFFRVCPYWGLSRSHCRVATAPSCSQFRRNQN